MTQYIPLGRVGTDLEIAHAVTFLASEEAAYITGHTLDVTAECSWHEHSVVKAAVVACAAWPRRNPASSSAAPAAHTQRSDPLRKCIHSTNNMASTPAA